MSKSHDTLARRLALILTKLNSGESFSVQELADEFGVSTKTIQRDINDRLNYIPLQKNGKRYSLEGYALGKLGFEDIKSFATLSGIKSLYPTLSNEFITGILNAKLNRAYLIKNGGFEEISEKKEEFEYLSAAIVKNSSVSFEYKGTQRVVNPYKLINNNGIWYLVADESDTLKTFTFSKIKKFRWDNDTKTFTPKKSFLKIIEKNDTNWFSKKSIEVTLQIDNHAKEYFTRKTVLPNREFIAHNDTHFIISTKVSYDDEILKIVKYWIPYIKILKPLYLKNQLEESLKKYLTL